MDKSVSHTRSHAPSQARPQVHSRVHPGIHRQAFPAVAPGAPGTAGRAALPTPPLPESRTRPGRHEPTGILARRSTCDRGADEAPKAAYLPLSRTTDRVLAILLEGDLYRLRAESVAEILGISCTTLRRRLRNDHTNYQFLLDRARQYRCETRLRERWLPGKCMADELGYLEVNSFYRAFRRWTGMSYSDYKLREFP